MVESLSSPLIIGNDWLEQLQPKINYKTKLITVSGARPIPFSTSTRLDFKANVVISKPAVLAPRSQTKLVVKLRKYVHNVPVVVTGSHPDYLIASKIQYAEHGAVTLFVLNPFATELTIPRRSQIAVVESLPYVRNQPSTRSKDL